MTHLAAQQFALSNRRRNMQKAVPSKSGSAQSTATKSPGPVGSQAQSSEGPRGNLAELASVVNQSSRVQTQLKLAQEMQSASQPEAPGHTASGSNQGPVAAVQRKRMEEKASPAQFKRKEKPAAQMKGKLEEKKTTAHK